MAKETFIAYDRWFKYSEFLSDEDFGRLFRAVRTYRLSGKEPDETALSQTARVLFYVIKDDLDRDRAKYDNVCEKRKEAAMKRWKKDDDASDKASGNANAFFASVCTRDNEYEYDNDNDYEYDYDYENEYEYDVVVENKNENVNEGENEAHDALASKASKASASVEKMHFSREDEKLTAETGEETAAFIDGSSLSDEFKRHMMERARIGG